MSRKKSLNERLQLRILGKYDENINLTKTDVSSVIISNAKDTVESKLKALHVTEDTMKNINNSNCYYTKTVLQIDGIDIVLYNIDSYYKVTMDRIKRTLEIFERVLSANVSTSLVRYPSGNIVLSSETCLNDDGTYIKPGYDYTNTNASKYYGEGEYEKMLSYLQKDKKLTEYRVWGHLSKDLLNPNRSEPPKLIEVYINSTIVSVDGFPAALEEYFIPA
jgi:hypothetical protein